MNRKNVILIAVLINAGLLAVLLIAALTTQEEPTNPTVAEGPAPLPLFDEAPLYLPPEEPVLPLSELEPPLHKLPPLVVSEPAPPPAAPVVVSPPLPVPLDQITVRKGDNLEKIAKVHRTTVEEILKINQLSSSFLKIGQVLKIPKGGEKKPLETGPEYYTMKVGDNPWAIAVKHRMKVEELLRLNGLNEERARKLKPGDRLRIR